MEKISRLWTTRKIFTARSNKMCERFEDASVIQTVAIVIQRYFTPTTGKTLQDRKEPDNDEDSFVVAIIENDS